MAELTKSQQEAIEAIGAAIQSRVEQIGPHWDGEGEPPCEARQAMLTEWVLMSAWVDPEDGETYRTFLRPFSQPAHHTKGLLWEGLYWNVEQ